MVWKFTLSQDEQSVDEWGGWGLGGGVVPVFSLFEKVHLIAENWIPCVENLRMLIDFLLIVMINRVYLLVYHFKKYFDFYKHPDTRKFIISNECLQPWETYNKHTIFYNKKRLKKLYFFYNLFYWKTYLYTGGIIFNIYNMKHVKYIYINMYINILFLWSCKRTDLRRKINITKLITNLWCWDHVLMTRWLSLERNKRWTSLNCRDPAPPSPNF